MSSAQKTWNSLYTDKLETIWKFNPPELQKPAMIYYVLQQELQRVHDNLSLEMKEFTSNVEHQISSIKELELQQRQRESVTAPVSENESSRSPKLNKTRNISFKRRTPNLRLNLSKEDLMRTEDLDVEIVESSPKIIFNRTKQKDAKKLSTPKTPSENRNIVDSSLVIPTNIINTLETSYKSNCTLDFKTEESEDIKFNLEDLHHSIDIKDEEEDGEALINEKPAKNTGVCEKLFHCAVCGNKYAHKSSLISHLKTHTGEKPFACEICVYKCCRQAHLISHLKTHTGERPFACEFCDYKCAQKSSLKSHLHIIHTGTKPFACEICDYKCATKSYLKEHLKTHTGEKPFACDICGYKFGKGSHLKRHLKIHTGQKPFACEICDYKSVRKSSLKDHLKTHTGEKPFACEICDYKCVHKSSLKVHLKTHTGEKSFA